MFAIYAAPVVLSGQATFTGYIKLDDSATFMALIDRAMAHGRSLAGLPPSSYEATLWFNLRTGYPLGSMLPLGAGGKLVGQNIAWLYQPYMAFMGGMLGLVLYELARPAIASRPWRALIAFVAAQAALLYGYVLWGGIKESAGAWMVPLVAALIPFTLPVRGPVLAQLRRLVPLAVAAAAVLDTLSAGGVAWLVAPLVLAVVLVAVYRSSGRGAPAGAPESGAPEPEPPKPGPLPARPGPSAAPLSPLVWNVRPPSPRPRPSSPRAGTRCSPPETSGAT